MKPKKPKPKTHSTQQKNARALRRALWSITPESCHPQKQSPLFSTLPPEIRFLIFEYAVTQTSDYTFTLEKTSRHYRPGHEHPTRISTSLLLTCRLIYSETRAIPLLSTTHHLFGDDWNPVGWPQYLFHLSSQQGQNLYHLHATTSWDSMFDFSRLLLPHLHWRKLTWTLRVPTWQKPNDQDYWSLVVDDLNLKCPLSVGFLPSSCREVNVEIELRADYDEPIGMLRERAAQYRSSEAQKRDGLRLPFDEEYSIEYTWDAMDFSERSDTGHYVARTYHVIRLCWRERVPEREYMHYDHVDCLRSKIFKPVIERRAKDGEEAELD